MGETIKFILFCLSWFPLFFISVSSKPNINEYPIDSETFDSQEIEFGLKRENLQSLQQPRSISKVNRKPTIDGTVLAFGTTPYSIATLERISRSSIRKPRNGRTKQFYPLRTRTTGGKKQAPDDSFFKRINAVNFLKNYNYISHHTTGNHDFKTAVETFQRFMHLPVTGHLDNATMNEMKRKRCGVPDVEIDDPSPGERQKRFAISKKKWNTTSLLYGFERYTNDMSVATQKAIIAKAFKFWADAGGMVFTLTNDLSNANIKIMFGTKRHGTCNTPFDGSGNILGHAFFPTDGRLHFDDDEFFTDGVNSGTNLLSVAVHEIGHTLGLAHSSDKNSIMFPSSPGYIPNLALGKEDVNAIKYLYAGGTSSPGLGVSVCKDILPSCASNAGYCKQYPDYMNASCPKTCNFC
ncbi:metalloendoproteinase 1-like [Actinia tenebrosa]|uniref:Metalloendoproteinase 1-like n=1 Tax=Actinia tenebrosa TaxID=6105 RepID=A0A6P8ICZ2_ACTTE|nr:metalloendoproteinase 1-like [Actinia tenebrosa]